MEKVMTNQIHDHTPVAEGEVQYCAVHTTVETNLRCNKCGRLMCTKCAVRTPVGYRCKECVKGHQTIFYNSNKFDPIIQFVITLPLSAIAALIIGFIGSSFFWIGWMIAFTASSAVGAGIASLAHRAVGKRRGRYSWLAVSVAMVIGALASPLLSGLPLLLMAPDAGLMIGAAGFTNIGWWIYVVVATGAAASTLRLGGRGGRVRF
jgi:hypothetical protein